MTATEKARADRSERNALLIGMYGNLFMGAAGLLAAFLSNSQALLLDGLFSLIGFFSALVARRVSKRVDAGPDRLRPFGYAADESIFTTFRSLSLLVVVLAAAAFAAISIGSYLKGAEPPPLIYGPMIAYFALIGATCAGLWLFHYRAWRKGGRRSEILQLEAKAAAFDTLVTGAAGVGILGIALLGDGPLAPIAPIGDSIVVLGLCLLAVGSYVKDFRTALGELAGITAAPNRIAVARRAVRADLSAVGLRIVDMTVMKTGRSFLVVIYVDRDNPVHTSEIDDLVAVLEPKLGSVLGRTDVYIILSKYGRALPPPEAG